MPVYTSDALILRTYKLGEADRIVVFLTRDRGKKRGVAKGARRREVALHGALESLTRAGVAYYERELRDLVRINYIEPQRSPLASSRAAARRVGARARRVLRRADRRWAPEGHADERLYRLGRRSSTRLPTARRPSGSARYFEFWLLRLQGVYPQLSRVRRAAALRRRARDAAARVTTSAAVRRREDVVSLDAHALPAQRRRDRAPRRCSDAPRAGAARELENRAPPPIHAPRKS
jgi:DNA repair protein RecO (recombination protein O)